MTATCLEYSKRRLSSFLDEIKRIKGSEFPYKDSEVALGRIENVFNEYLETLKSLDPKASPRLIRQACAAGLAGLWEYLPLLGFILRSTNARNSFEIFGPLLRLGWKIVGPETRLIVSSEWDYSPFVYIGYKDLSDYILIGFPAHESSNPFLLPLAGHELGHLIWSAGGLATKYDADVKSKLIQRIRTDWRDFVKRFPECRDAEGRLEIDVFAQQIWSPAAQWALRQAEETFCDFVGLRIFGTSFLYAFAYLLAPRQTGARSVVYPALATRAANLCRAAKIFAIDIPAEYTDQFDDGGPPDDFDNRRIFLLSLADAVLADVNNSLLNDAKIQLQGKLNPEASDEAVRAILADFEDVAPATGSGSLANILNAGWRAFNDGELWKDIPQIQDKERTLRELILKSIEVLEYEELLSENDS